MIFFGRHGLQVGWNAILSRYGGQGGRNAMSAMRSGCDGMWGNGAASVMCGGDCEVCAVLSGGNVM